MLNWTTSSTSSSTDGNSTFWKNFDAAKVPESLPNGIYNALLTGWEGEKSRSGTPRIKFTFKITEGEFSGQLALRYAYLTEAASPYTRAFCESLGINPKMDVGNYPPIHTQITVELKPWSNGQSRPEVTYVRKLNQGLVVQPETVHQSTDKTDAGIPGVL